MSDWRHRAACAGLNDDTFYPTAKPGTRHYRIELAAARAVCARCPVTAECLADADGAGVWGGLDVSERRELRRTRRAA